MTLKPEPDPADEGQEPLAPPVPMSEEHDLVPPPSPAPPPTRAAVDDDAVVGAAPAPGDDTAVAADGQALVPAPGTELVAAGGEPERFPAPYGASASTELGPVLRRRRSRKPLVAAGIAAVAIAGGVAIAAGGKDASKPAAVAAAPAKARTADKAPAAVDAMAPLPKAHPRVVQPVAGETSQAPVKPVKAAPSHATHHGPPKITGPATVGGNDTSDPGVRNLQADKATALPNGVALPPLEAPEAVLDVIRAGNIIARTPYKWGGGHGRFQDNGYDCSGSVSYALYYAGLLDGPHTSGELMAYGKPGPGKWITIYASPTHVYMTVAGIGFDTSAASPANHESRWRNNMRSNAGFEVRHPDGL